MSYILTASCPPTPCHNVFWDIPDGRGLGVPMLDGSRHGETLSLDESGLMHVLKNLRAALRFPRKVLPIREQMRGIRPPEPEEYQLVSLKNAHGKFHVMLCDKTPISEIPRLLRSWYTITFEHSLERYRDWSPSMPTAEPLSHDIVAKGAARTVLPLGPQSPTRLVVTTYEDATRGVVSRLERAFDPNLEILEFIAEAPADKDIIEAHAIALSRVVATGTM